MPEGHVRLIHFQLSSVFGDAARRGRESYEQSSFRGSRSQVERFSRGGQGRFELCLSHAVADLEVVERAHRFRHTAESGNVSEGRLVQSAGPDEQVSPLERRATAKRSDLLVGGGPSARRGAGGGALKNAGGGGYGEKGDAIESRRHARGRRGGRAARHALGGVQ